MMLVKRRVHSLAGFAAVLGLHAFVLYFLLIERSDPGKAAPVHYSQLLLIVLPPPKPAVKMPEPSRIPAAKPVREKSIDTPIPAEVRSPLPVETPAAIPPPDPFNENTRVDIDSLVKQAGKADREIRPANDMRTYGPAPGSMEAVMTRAFNEAKLAVPLKWYEAARISEVTPPGARKPIYQVKTAFGTYCLYYPDKLTEGTGQPKMADCPRSMGR